MHIKTNTFTNFKLTKLTSGSSNIGKPIFYQDETRLIVSNNNEVHIYSTETGEHLKQLFTCESAIINLQVNPKNDKEIIAFSENGQYISYNEETIVEKNLTLKRKCNNRDRFPKYTKYERVKMGKDVIVLEDESDLSSVKFIHALIEKDVVYASWFTKDECLAHISAFDFSSGKEAKKRLLYPEPLMKIPRNFDICNGILVTIGLNFIQILNMQTKQEAMHFFQSEKSVTCLAISPTEPVLATGDSLGRITIWENIFNSCPLKDIQHWHFLPLRTLVFSEEGTHILSGGDENVLVKWSLESRMKTFLPRLSSEILHVTISKMSRYLAVLTGDGRILIMNSNFSCTATIQHFSNWSSSQSTQCSAICTYDARTDAVVLAGRTGHIQYFSLADCGRFLYTFDITGINFRTSLRTCVLENVDVRFVRFSRCGKWLISAESSSDESRIKFWEFDEVRQEYMLNTNIEAPHGTGIWCLESAADEMVVTTGPDNVFRLWSVVEKQHLNAVQLRWAPTGHAGFRQLPVTVADFSQDNSAVGVGFGPTLTVWDTDDCSFKCNLTPPLKRDPIKIIRFGNKQMSHLVVTGTDLEITTWNLVTLCIQWKVSISVTTIVRDLNSTYMCAFSKKGGLFVFQPASATLEIHLENVSDSEVTGGVFVPKGDSFELFFVTRSQILYRYGEDDERLISQSGDSMKITPFAAIRAEISTKDVREVEQMGDVLVGVDVSTAELLQRGAHTQPPISLICNDLLRRLLLSSATVQNQVADADEEVVYIKAEKSVDIPSDPDETVLRNALERLFFSAS